MKQPKLSDLYTCNLLKLYHKLYRNKLPPYFDIFLPEFAEHNHMLRNDLIRIPVVRCEFGEINAKYQMHLRLHNRVGKIPAFMSKVHAGGIYRYLPAFTGIYRRLLEFTGIY